MLVVEEAEVGVEVELAADEVKKKVIFRYSHRFSTVLCLGSAGGGSRSSSSSSKGGGGARGGGARSYSRSSYRSSSSVNRATTNYQAAHRSKAASFTYSYGASYPYYRHTTYHYWGRPVYVGRYRSSVHEKNRTLHSGQQSHSSIILVRHK